jgi:signal transduction histidine kinase
MRRRILFLVVSITTVIVLAFAIPLGFQIRIRVAQNADNATTQLASALAFNVDRSTTAELDKAIAAADRAVSITLPNGRKLGSTPADSYQPRGAQFGNGLPGPGDPGGGGPPEQLVAVADGQLAVRVRPAATGNYIVRVFEFDDDRYGGADGWYLLLAAGSLALLLLGIGAGEIVTRRITRPLLRTADTAQQLSIGDTTARAPTDGPREVADVGIALNRLADRIDQLIMEERETVADLSHRLRTPLTRLRLDAEALTDPDEAERVSARVSEVERMLTAVIHAARRPQREGRLPSCDATAVVSERVDFWSALTDEQHRASSISLPDDSLAVRASAEDLGAAVDALLENVVAHTSEGTPFSVTLAATDDGARLEIADDGLGIPESSEIRGRSDRGSTGLGLDIARRCAEAAGGSMTIGAAPSGGALVTLLLHSP